MPDDRPLREKLLAMANQAASPKEAAIARDLLARLDASSEPLQSPGIITRASVMRAPDRTTAPRIMSYRNKNGTLVTFEIDEAF